MHCVLNSFTNNGIAYSKTYKNVSFPSFQLKEKKSASTGHSPFHVEQKRQIRQTVLYNKQVSSLPLEEKLILSQDKKNLMAQSRKALHLNKLWITYVCVSILQKHYSIQRLWRAAFRTNCTGKLCLILFFRGKWPCCCDWQYYDWKQVALFLRKNALPVITETMSPVDVLAEGICVNAVVGVDARA